MQQEQYLKASIGDLKVVFMYKMVIVDLKTIVSIHVFLPSYQLIMQA